MNTFQSLATPFMAMWLLAIAMVIAVAASREMPMEFSSGELARIAGYGEERLSSVLVVGTLLCQACPISDLHSSPISGAKVGVGCKAEGKEKKKKIEWIHGTTDEYGEFMVDIPSHLHAIPRLEDACKVRVLSMPKNSLCGNPTNSMKPPQSIKLSSVGNSIRVYTTGTVKLISHGISTKESSSKNHDI
ncbi:hypothetical protein J5N97_010190 [Dioscorea zingiberensis]|uniref:Pollen Ole e 1 allergen and extensin family protein n=1 Tax=Dioscorea zingiberensis TaxID=325984 RepID=A0A9D5CXY7_9LILI|nr:hypothetical protein J5N97_010190 [Dioscorea zingiberensis]